MQGLSLVTKIIAKESVLPWQVAGGWLLEAELLLSVRHAHICRSAGHVTKSPPLIGPRLQGRGRVPEP